MKFKHSVMPGYLGRVADKFHEYHSAQSLKDRLSDVKKIKNVDGIEIVYPSEFKDQA